MMSEKLSRLIFKAELTSYKRFDMPEFRDYRIHIPDLPNLQLGERHRFSKEIAEELLKDRGDLAYLYALEGLERRMNEKLWRDVLSWLDDLTKQGEQK